MKENGVQSSTESSTISYSNVVVPEGITNKTNLIVNKFYQNFNLKSIIQLP